MNKLTEQQLQKIANPGENDIGGTQSPIVTQMAIELLEARAELAAIKGGQQPVAWTDAEELRFPHATSDMWPMPLEFGRDIPLFTHPAPNHNEQVLDKV